MSQAFRTLIALTTLVVTSTLAQAQTERTDLAWSSSKTTVCVTASESVDRVQDKMSGFTCEKISPETIDEEPVGPGYEYAAHQPSTPPPR